MSFINIIRIILCIQKVDLSSRLVQYYVVGDFNLLKMTPRKQVFKIEFLVIQKHLLQNYYKIASKYFFITCKS